MKINNDLKCMTKFGSWSLICVQITNDFINVKFQNCQKIDPNACKCFHVPLVMPVHMIVRCTHKQDHDCNVIVIILIMKWYSFLDVLFCASDVEQNGSWTVWFRHSPQGTEVQQAQGSGRQFRSAVWGSGVPAGFLLLVPFQIRPIGHRLETTRGMILV